MNHFYSFRISQLSATHTIYEHVLHELLFHSFIGGRGMLASGLSISPVAIAVRIPSAVPRALDTPPIPHGGTALLVVPSNVAGVVAGEHADLAVGDVVVHHLGLLRMDSFLDLEVLVGPHRALQFHDEPGETGMHFSLVLNRFQG